MISSFTSLSITFLPSLPLSLHSVYVSQIGEATGGVLLEKVFLEISQNSQENTCARVSFLIKLQVTLLKGHSNTGVFL